MIREDSSMLIEKEIYPKDLVNKVYTYENYIKGAVDIKLKKLALGGQWHVDAEKLLLDNGSVSQDCWGFNILFDGGIEYNSMINIKPQLGNKLNDIQDEKIKNQIDEILKGYIL
jgi:Protein of unknown function (DUF5674)